MFHIGNITFSTTTDQHSKRKVSIYAVTMKRNFHVIRNRTQLPVTFVLLADHRREYSDDSWTGPGPVAERRRQEEQEAQQLKEKEEQLRAMEVGDTFLLRYFSIKRIAAGVLF